MIYVFFFIKQKTAYEMRISDWSSDVCSSDLRNVRLAEKNGRGLRPVTQLVGVKPQVPGSLLDDAVQAARDPDDDLANEFLVLVGVLLAEYRVPVIERDLQVSFEEIEQFVLLFPRSEEHTSELQSLMRISFAVFCLKKNKYQ